MTRMRRSQLFLSPWTLAVAGDTSTLRLPRGYFINGLAKTGAGPWTLDLWSPGSQLEPSRLLASHGPIHDASDVRVRLLSLVDLAAIDEHERTYRVVVTADQDGYVRSIEDA